MATTSVESAPEGSLLAVRTAKPFCFTAPCERLALLNIDWQRDFLEPGGFGDSLGNQVSLLQAALGPAAALLQAAREAGMPVFHTLEAHKPDLSDLPPAKKRRCSAIGEVLDEKRGRVLIEGEPGNAIVKQMAPVEGEVVIRKPGKGAFWNTDLEAELKRLGITHLLVTGVTTEVCVQTTIREANDRGYDCLMVTDATESYFPEFKEATMNMIVAQGGIAGWTASAAEVIASIEAGRNASRLSLGAKPATANPKAASANIPHEEAGEGSPSTVCANPTSPSQAHAVGVMRLDVHGEQYVDRSHVSAASSMSVPTCLEPPAPLNCIPASARAAAQRLLTSPIVAASNATARDIIANVDPMLKAVVPARDVVQVFKNGAKTILHAGPPVQDGFKGMCGPMQGAVIGAILLEGWAADPEAAAAFAMSGSLTLQPCHHHKAVGPMSGVLCPSMPVFVVIDASASTNGTAFCSINEGLGKVLRFGAHSDEVIDRLRWICNTLGPTLNSAVVAKGGLRLRPLLATALQMGDDGHNRCKALTMLIHQALSPNFIDLSVKPASAAAAVKEASQFLSQNAHFGLNLAMSMCKLTLDAIEGLEHCTFATAMARNGVEFGLTVAGDPQNWHLAPSPPVPSAVWFPGYGPADASLDLGDSAITETLGLGAPATAAAPALMAFVGGNAKLALQYTAEAKRIYAARGVWPELQIPSLDFEGIPMLLDVALVVSRRIRPAINTGIAHKRAGIGQIGTGVSRAPLAAFASACEALAARLD